MSEKKDGTSGKPEKSDDWALESPFDAIVSLEELINMPPFKTASDASGGTTTAGTRIPTWLDRKVVHLIEFRGTPYHLKSDVLRDAIYIGLRVLNMRYKSDPDWATEAKMAKTIDKANEVNRIKTRIRQFSSPIEELWAEGDEDQALSLFEEFIASTVEIDNEWSRNKQLQLIKGSHLLKEIAERSSAGVKRAVFGERGQKNAHT